MRKHDVRKWLHAILDLLPVILIPVFMIYSHRHEINDGSIQVQEKYGIDFNQKVTNGNFVNTDTYTFSSGNGTTENNILNFTSDSGTYPGVNKTIQSELGHVYVISVNFYGWSDLFVNWSGLNNRIANNLDTNTFNDIRFEFTASSYQPIFTFFLNRPQSSVSLYFSAFNIFDLTQMFGAGNEPSLTEFNELFDNIFYPYVASDKQLINKPTLTTYNDTDIMSQMTYQLYNSVDKYFNMGNVFNLNGVYDWFNLNIFNGHAPIYIFIVWQIALYEFVMDLLFLLYGLFMWFIDIVENIMNKPFKSIK